MSEISELKQIAIELHEIQTYIHKCYTEDFGNISDELTRRERELNKQFLSHTSTVIELLERLESKS